MNNVKLRKRLLKLMACGNWMTLREVHKVMRVRDENDVFKILYHSWETFKMNSSDYLNTEFKLLKPTCSHPECNIRVVLES